MENIETRNSIAEYLIRFYNAQAGTAFRAKNEWNQKVVLNAYDRANQSSIAVKNHVRRWVRENAERSTKSDAISVCFDAFTGETTEVKAEVKTEPVTDTQVQYSMSILEKAVIDLISKTQAERIESNIMGQVQNQIREFIQSEYGTIERKVCTLIDGKKVDVKGIQHEKFETILKFVANNEPVYLEGPAGSGKNVICKQVAEALGLKFYFTNAVTQEYKLTGFTDAMGKFQETQFYKAFTQGGLFMLDEMDASIPEVLVILNAAIANRYFDFPAPIGYVEAHPDFRVVAAGNTTGHGADMEYVGRNQLDGASLDRFAVVKVDYSPLIEESVSLGNHELLDFCRQFRKGARKAGLNVIVSYRAIGRLAKMVNIMEDAEAIDTCLIKGLEKDDVNMVRSNMSGHSKYMQALDKLIAEM